MRAGARSALVEIQRNVPAQDEAGQPISSWQTVATAWANVRHRSGMEAVRGDTPASVVQVSVRIPYPVVVETPIDSSMRLLCEGEPYDIQAVLPDRQKRQHVDLVCQLVPARVE
ncbi:phage head closure protein [Cupriavidus gilardii]|uniref:Phage head closure protein n=1 Tax=Cupriavidus gilardii TaxID=82541 RepID=A0ABY4VNU7_9BURK|nr:phage head closure protein [Cupriavidus gilardii]USE78910.1 phage head closure protein [Cupriavidus gilardii]